MNRTLFFLILPAFLGCGVNNTVASDNQTPEEQLSTELSARCTSLCDWAAQCTPPPCPCAGDSCNCTQQIDASTCPANCEKSLVAYAGKGDACASAGLTILTCLSGASCANVFQPDLCQPDATTRAKCTSDSSADSPGSDSSSSGVAGSGPTGGSGGASSTSAPVTCQLGDKGGVAGSANTGGSFVSCEQFSSDCSDGHSYDAVCVVNSQNVSACSCLVDDLAQITFTPSVTCPSWTEFNARCGWSLVQQ